MHSCFQSDIQGRAVFVKSTPQGWDYPSSGLSVHQSGWCRGLWVTRGNTQHEYLWLDWTGGRGGWLFKWWEQGRLCSSRGVAAPWAAAPRSNPAEAGGQPSLPALSYRDRLCQDRPCCAGRTTLEWQLLVDQGAGWLDPRPNQADLSLRQCQHSLYKTHSD